MISAAQQIRQCFLWLIVFVFSTGLFCTVTSAGAENLIKLSKKEKCPVCGMFVAKYPQWVAEIAFKDGSHVVFDGCKDLFKYYFNISKYDNKRSTDAIASISVTEYYTTQTMAAGEVFFIVGSDVLGPMGHEFIPVLGRENAETFKLDHKGSKILSFTDISINDIPK